MIVLKVGDIVLQNGEEVTIVEKHKGEVIKSPEGFKSKRCHYTLSNGWTGRSDKFTKLIPEKIEH